MHEQLPEDVDWGARAYTDDPRSAYDALRERCPVARSADGSWMITGYDEVRRCALDSDGFSNCVSARLQVPNGLDGAEHRRFRAIVDDLLAPSRVLAWRARFQAIAEARMRTLSRTSTVDAVWEIGAPLAVRFQCAWLGWPLDAEPALLDWMLDHRAAMRGSDPSRRAAVAARFDTFVSEQVQRTERASESSIMTELLQATVEDPSAERDRRRLTSAEIVSILRNWTAGDLGTIAACFGVVAFQVAADAALQSNLRAALGNPAMLDRAIDECLRIDDPFLWNRRVTTREVTVANRTIPAGAKVILNWTAANRDPKRFADPDDCRPDDNTSHNLVYGIGQHVCPGRELATLQLREALGALLRGAPVIRLAPRSPVRATAPTGGYDHVWLTLE